MDESADGPGGREASADGPRRRQGLTDQRTRSCGGGPRESNGMVSIRTQIGPADHGRKMTLDEFREAEEQPGFRYELAGGVLEVTEVPNDSHWQVVDNFHEAMSTHRRQHPG